MATVAFSAGFVALKPQGTNQLPQILGGLSDVKVKLTQKKIALPGATVFTEDFAAGPAEITGSCKFRAWGAGTYAAVISGAASATGSKVGVFEETATIPTTPFIVTVANGANFFEDLGVYNATTGLYMLPVASGPTTGQYAVNATTGAYTFASADAGNPVRISYSYTASAVGKTVTYTNAMQGQATKFILTGFNAYGTKRKGFRFPAVVFDDLDIGMSLSQFGDASLTFQVCNDPTTNMPFSFYEAD